LKRLAKYVLVLAVSGTVTAIAAPDSTTPSPTSAAGSGSGSGSSTPPPMSPADMKASAATLKANIEADSQTVAQLQQVAKKKTDVIKLTCVNDRLVQVKAQGNIADSTASALDAAIAKNSDDRNSLYKSLASTADSVKSLREQAKGCVGQDDVSKQESGLEVTAPPNLDNPGTLTPPIIGGTGGPEAPGFASPYD
jgi:hypothetical protein